MGYDQIQHPDNNEAADDALGRDEYTSVLFIHLLGERQVLFEIGRVGIAIGIMAQMLAYCTSVQYIEWHTKAFLLRG